MIKVLNKLVTRFSRPLNVIEQIIYGLVIASLVVTFWIVHEIPEPDSSTLINLSEKFVGVVWVLVIMAVFSLIGLIFTLEKSYDRKNYEIRSVSTFVNSIGFFFLAILTISYLGFDNALWVNYMAISMISMPLYLALKASQHYGTTK